MRKKILETRWFLKSRKCVACVKLESYLLLRIPNSHFNSALKCTWRRQNLLHVSCRPPPPAPPPLSWLYIIHSRVYVFLEEEGRLQMKTFRNPKQPFSNGWTNTSQIDGGWWEWDGEGLFWRYDADQHLLRSLWRQTPTHRAGQAISYPDALASSLLDVLVRVLRSEPVP